MGVNFIFGDITMLKADAVVNVIYTEAGDGGNVNSAVHAAAGPELEEYRKMQGPCPTGGAQLTPGFNLSARYIVHTAAPSWRAGAEQEEKWLSSCYRRSLELAARYQCKTVAIPVFSAGNYGFPYEEALQTAYDTCRYYLAENNSTMEIIIALYEGSLRYNDMDEAAAGTFRTVAEYVNSQYRQEEDIKEGLRIAAAVKPYFPEESHFREISLPNGGTLLIIPKGTEGHFSISSCPPGSVEIPDREELIPEESFTRKLLRYIDEKGMTAPLVYGDAGYDRKLFSKIQSDPEYHPRKYTAVRFALALKLDPEETEDLLNAAGFALSRSKITDLVIAYCISHNMRSVCEVNTVLETWGLETI